jgi:hypothetical protein
LATERTQYDQRRTSHLRSVADVRRHAVAHDVVMADNSRQNMRVSDADRAATAQQLADALAEGRLTTAEADERLAACWSACHEHELADLTEDLPTPVPVPANTAQVARNVWSRPLLTHAAIAALVSTLLIARWAVVPDFAGRPGFAGPPQFVDHSGFFWPIFPIFWLAVSVVVHYGIRVRRGRQLGG